MTSNNENPQLQLFSQTAERKGGRGGSFEPSRLTQARVLRELTKGELANQVGVTPAAIGQFEAGVARPRPELVTALAKTLDMPTGFFAPGRPMHRLDTTDAHFRSLRSTRAKDRAKAMAYVEHLSELIGALERLVEFPPLSLPVIPAEASPQEAARIVRDAWRVPFGPLSHLAARIEASGVVISLLPLTEDALSRVSAFSTRALDRPIIVITPERNQSIYRHRFTCAHELGHLLLHTAAIPGDRQQEREADQFAAELLMPSEEIRRVLPSTTRISALAAIGREWGVSVKALLFRMGELGLASDVSVRRAHQRLASTSIGTDTGTLDDYPGESPSLLRQAVSVVTEQGSGIGSLAEDLRWNTSHLRALAGVPDPKPKLRPVTVIEAG